jgi:hypothetical protein
LIHYVPRALDEKRMKTRALDCWQYRKNSSPLSRKNWEGKFGKWARHYQIPKKVERYDKGSWMLLD